MGKSFQVLLMAFVVLKYISLKSIFDLYIVFLQEVMTGVSALDWNRLRGGGNMVLVRPDTLHPLLLVALWL